MVAEAPAHLAAPCSIPENSHQRLSVMGSRTLLLLGDVHGRFDHVLHEALSRRPAGIVFLGDIEPPRSMRELIAQCVALLIVAVTHKNHGHNFEQSVSAVDRLAGS